MPCILAIYTQSLNQEGKQENQVSLLSRSDFFRTEKFGWGVRSTAYLFLFLPGRGLKALYCPTWVPGKLYSHKPGCWKWGSCLMEVERTDFIVSLRKQTPPHFLKHLPNTLIHTDCLHSPNSYSSHTVIAIHQVIHTRGRKNRKYLLACLSFLTFHEYVIFSRL